MTYSLRRPLEGLTGFPLLIWPFVYAQLLALKAWVRREHGPGLPYRIAISPWGIVRLVRLPTDMAVGAAAPAAFRPPVFAFAALPRAPGLAAALAPEVQPRLAAPRRLIRTRIIAPATLALHPDTS
ncbi:MAG: hypothetical protein RLO80_06810 [Hyphomonas sp.]